MKATLAEAAAAGGIWRGSVVGTPARSRASYASLFLLPAAAFGVYWLSALALAARDETFLFGADTILYMELANGRVVERLGGFYAFDRITRFHPLTTALAVAWMNALGWLTPWLTPQQLLKAMFAAVGAVGAGAAVAAFAAVVPRRQAPLWGIIYAASLSVWYFASIEESKIVTATLAAAYIAVYLRLRQQWSTRGAALLTGILLLACLNEIIAAFLVAIPAIDTLVRRGWSLRHGRWIVWHGLAAPAAFVLLEAVVKRLTGSAASAGPATEGASHLSMLLFYVSQNDFSPATLYSFITNWLFFAVAAPTLETSLAPAEWPEYTAYFEAALRGYLSSPITIGLAGLFGIMAAASALPGYRSESDGNRTALVLALLAYALLRGTFWFIVNPSECLLFSSGTVLAHVLILAILFTGSKLPGKPALLAACALLLVVTNGTFIIGQ
jgi:hypothetical protein